MNLDNLVIKNGSIYKDGKFILADIKIEAGIITEIGTDLTGEQIIDANGKLVCSSFIDAHVHLREPGYTDKEDIESGTYSAVKGGYSHIMAMPNTNPVMDNYDLISYFNELCDEKAHCHVYPFAAISIGLKGEELVDIEKISKLKIAGFSDDGVGVQSSKMMLEAMKRVKNNNHIMSLHCEDVEELKPVMGSMNLSKQSEILGEIGINNASEWKMIERDLTMLGDSTCPYHVCHISTKESVELIRGGIKNGLDVSCEVTPHHLVLIDEDIKTLDPNFKMNPPLRGYEDRQALIDGLNDQTIKLIATDHAPHTKLEKNKEFSKAPFGIIGLDMSFSLLYTKLVLTNKVKLETILDAMTVNPMQRFGVEDYGLKPGVSANLVMINLDETVSYNEENLGSKACNSPFLNQEMYGKIEMTITKNKCYDWR